MEMATRAAKLALRRYLRTSSSDAIHDIASDVVLEYLALGEAETAEDQESFERFCFNAASRWGKKYRYSRELSIEQYASETMQGDNYIALLLSGSTRGRQRPTQELHMEVMDVLRWIDRLPDQDRKTVVGTIDHGDVVEFSKEKNISLFEAMAELKRARSIMDRLRDDDELDRREDRQAP